ncbi:hypothetical protein D3C72_1237850 [compost metagenome]
MAASSTLAASNSGKACSIIVSALTPASGATDFQMVSVMKGMMGCARRSRVSSTVTRV